MRKKGTNGTKIAIVAQDPFRSNFGSGKMVLSTPFGLHSPVCERNNEMFYRLIESLLMEEATVYVTDCKKACCGIPSGTSDKCGRCKEVDCENYRSTDVAKKFQEYLCADDILNDEINMFGPDVIIALGKVATQTLFPRFPIGGFKKYALSCWAIENQYAREDVKWAWSLLHPSRKNYHYFKNSGRATNIGAIEKKVYRYYQKAAKRIVSKAKGVD